MYTKHEVQTHHNERVITTTTHMHAHTHTRTMHAYVVCMNVHKQLLPKITEAHPAVMIATDKAGSTLPMH